MAQKRVVSIEDRIPKLKKERRKKANRKLIFYLLLFFMLIFIVVYLQSPMSYIKHIQVSGDEWISEDEIIKVSELDSKTNYWSVQLKDIQTNIEAHPQIKDVKMSKTFPNTINIDVNELIHTGYVELDGGLYPILENGDLLSEVDASAIDGDVPLLRNFKDNHYVRELSKELSMLSSFVSSLVSEIYWIPSDSNPYKIKLFMTDGYEVEASIRNFSSTIESYPSIVAQLDGSKDGILKMDDGGAVFTPSKVATSDEERENENAE